MAEQLNLPTCFFGKICFNAMAELKSETDYIPPEVEYMMSLGIDSTDEMDAMCNYFKCEYYELDDSKVYIYRKSMK